MIPMKLIKPGRAKRRTYKPERKPARKKGVFSFEKQAPVDCPDANHYEIAMALYSICRSTWAISDTGDNNSETDARLEIGQGGDYDPIKDQYTVIGKVNGKAQELMIPGIAVAALINTLRMWNGVEQFDKNALVKAIG